MKLHLFIPSLLWSDKSETAIYQSLATPSLDILLAKGQMIRRPPEDSSTWLCQSFGIQRQRDWPVAPIMQHNDNQEYTETKKNGAIQDFWLRADPVHLRIEQNHIMLADSQVFHISKDEALQLTNEINRHLSNENLVLLPLNPYRWYIRLTQAPQIHTQTIDTATCKNINRLLPTGKDNVTWHKMFNEIQMLLHEHPLNQARTARNELPINSVWFWGGGFMPQTVRSSYTHIWSNEPFSQALANISNTSHSRLPDNAFSCYQTASNPENQLIILDSLLHKEKYKDAHGWRESLLDMERNWFAPLYTALKNNQINELKITTTNENTSSDFVTKRKSLWKFWAPIKPLPVHAVKQ